MIKYLMIILFMVSCSGGYTVKKQVEYEIKTIRWICKKQNHFFAPDDNVAFCDTKKECNKICMEARKNNE